MKIQSFGRKSTKASRRGTDECEVKADRSHSLTRQKENKLESAHEKIDVLDLTRLFDLHISSLSKFFFGTAAEKNHGREFLSDFCTSFRSVFFSLPREGLRRR